MRKPKWDLNRLEPLKKDFYIPQSSVSTRPYYEIEDWRKNKEISLKGTKKFQTKVFSNRIILTIETPASAVA